MNAMRPVRPDAGAGAEYRSALRQVAALVFCGGIAAVAALHPSFAFAQAAYPTQTIRFLVPQAAGGSTDTLAREIGTRLAEAWGNPVIVDNRAGANGIIGTELVAKSKPDGHTLLVGGTGTMAINQSLYAQLPYDPLKDFLPVAMFAKLNAEIDRILGAPAMREKLISMGVEPLPISPERFGEILAQDADRWAKTVKAAGVTGR